MGDELIVFKRPATGVKKLMTKKGISEENEFLLQKFIIRPRKEFTGGA